MISPPWKLLVVTAGLMTLAGCAGRDTYVSKMEPDELRLETDAALCRIGHEDTTPTRVYTELTRRNLLHARFGRQMMEGAVSQGMTWCEVIIAWGEPTLRSHEISDNKDVEVMKWVGRNDVGTRVYQMVRLSGGLVIEATQARSTRTVNQ